jgi:hypothetical protein
MDHSKITLTFKPAGEGIRLLLLHSTQDSLGQVIAGQLRQRLDPGIIVSQRRVANFGELLTRVEEADDFNVLMLVAHGDDVQHHVWLYNDINQQGNEMSVNIGEMVIALKNHVLDKLCLFGVCHFGTEDMAQAICMQACALACIAPKPNYAIKGLQVVNHFSVFLNAIQAHANVDVDVNDLHNQLKSSLGNLLPHLSIFPA